LSAAAGAPSAAAPPFDRPHSTTDKTSAVDDKIGTAVLRHLPSAAPPPVARSVCRRWITRGSLPAPHEKSMKPETALTQFGNPTVTHSVSAALIPTPTTQ
jgi:hypothetical protein